MTKDEELEQLRQEKTALRDQVAQLSQRIDVLEARLAKESHANHLSPSWERFHRQPKSQSAAKGLGLFPQCDRRCGLLPHPRLSLDVT